MSFKGIFIFKSREQCSKREGYEHYDYQYPSKSRHVNIGPSVDVDDSRSVEDVYVPSKITSIVDDTLADYGTLILVEINASFEGLVILSMN